MYTGTRYICDAEQGKPGHWHVCNRRATVSIFTASGTSLHYCERHRNHADDRLGKYFKRLPFAEPRPIID